MNAPGPPDPTAPAGARMANSDDCVVEGIDPLEVFRYTTTTEPSGATASRGSWPHISPLGVPPGPLAQLELLGTWTVIGAALLHVPADGEYVERRIGWSVVAPCPSPATA